MARQNQAMTDLLRYNAALLNTKRSQFDKSHSHATTFDSGYLIPIMWDRVVPGDEKKIRYSGLARMATPIHPTMDEAFLYTWAFYIPDRLWWDHAKEFYGENLDASFNPDGEYTMPSCIPTRYVVRKDTTFSDAPEASDLERYNSVGSLNDYLGFPAVSRNVYRDYLPYDDFRCTIGLHRSYQIIWNDYFRNSSVQPAVRINKGDNGDLDIVSDTFSLRKVNKIPDMFTSLLREPQAGADVLLPLGEFAPVVTRDASVYSEGDDVVGLRFGPPGIEQLAPSYLGFNYDNGFAVLGAKSDASLTFNDTSFAPSNLYANLSQATAASINSLRAAVTVQQLLERDAIAGKRYQNILQAHFGVFTPDATLQRPELLGASKTRIGMRQVLSTTPDYNSDDQIGVGTAGGVSVTNIDNEWICNKGFTEPGFIMVLAAVRPLHSYSQGLNPLLTKLDRYDHFWQVFDNLGNQPVYKYNILFAQDDVFDADEANKVFGYKEAWQEYRMIDNRVSGLFRPDVEGNLSSWNYTTYLDKYPTLNSAFISEDPYLIDRTIAVPSEPQFLLDSYFEYIDTKSMSVHSTPGLRFF